MDVKQAQQALYTLQAELARLKPTRKLAKDAVDYASANCEQVSEWLLTAKRREEES